MDYSEWKNAGKEVVVLGNVAGSYSVSRYEGFKSFNTGNFIIGGGVAAAYFFDKSNNRTEGATARASISYNAANGVLTVTNGEAYANVSNTVLGNGGWCKAQTTVNYIALVY